MKRKQRNTLIFLAIGLALMAILIDTRQPSSQSTLQEVSLPAKKATGRSLASYDPARVAKSLVDIPIKKETIKKIGDSPVFYKNRRVLFENQAPLDKQQLDELKFINKVAPEWKDNLKKKVLRFQAPSTRAEIEVIDDMIQVNQQGARYLQKVKIRLTRADGMVSKYMGIVDPETSKLERTWGQTHYELSPLKDIKFKVSP